MRCRSQISSRVESLELRRLLSALIGADLDSDDQISEALALGALTQTRSTTNQIDTATDVDLFSFSVAARQKVSFDIDPTPTAPAVDSLLRLFDSSGNQLAANDNAPAPGESSTTESFLSYTFPTAGTYFVGVSSSANINYNPLTGDGDTAGTTGPYTLILSPGLTGTISGNVGNGNETYIVDLFRHGSANPQPIAVDPNQQTWIVIHGRGCSRYTTGTPNIPRLASDILNLRPNDQVLTLDWSGPATAQSGILFREEDWIQPVAAWAAGALLAYGFNPANINLVGHSWGGNMTDELAERLGGVNTIFAIDPARNGSGAYNPNANFGTATAEIDFARHSNYSWAFFSRDGGVLGITGGDPQTPTSADESIVVTNSEHSEMWNLVASMFEAPSGPVAKYFKISRLLNHTPGPWSPNHYNSSAAAGGPYEAIITAASGGESPSTLTYVKGDTIPPAVSSSSFEYQTAPRQIKLTFSEDVSDTLSTDSLTIENLTTTAQFHPAALSYDFSANTATFDLPSGLSDANYTATLAHTTTKDLAGNAVSADYVHNFFILTGDLNGDRQVSIADFITLASNFGKSPATWGDGDLNYDNAVTISDFIDLASHFGQSLAIPAQPAIAAFFSPVLASPKNKHHRRPPIRKSQIHNAKSIIAPCTISSPAAQGLSARIWPSAS
jgi:pimeloyl-ACP methyl ester carboxylesterase